MWFGAVSDMDTGLVAAVWAFLGIVVTTLGTIAVQALRNRKESPVTTSQPVTDGSGALLTVAKDIGQLDQRADDNDERDDVQDHRLEALEQWAERHDPGWRRRD